MEIKGKLVRYYLQLVYIVVLLYSLEQVSGEKFPSPVVRNTIRRHLDLDENLSIKWEVDFNSELLYFKIIHSKEIFPYFGLVPKNSPTLQIVSFLSANESSEQSRLIEERLSEYGSLSDILEKSLPSETSQWELMENKEEGKSFSTTVMRTLRSQDWGTLTLVWGYRSTDTTVMDTNSKYGSQIVNLVDFMPEELPENEDDQIMEWKLERSTEMTPGSKTSYWCTIHEGPKLPQRHHLISFEAYFNDELSHNHTHHLVLYKCHGPEEIFKPLVGDEGSECYASSPKVLPTQYCRDFMYVWAVGGQPFNLPDHVGVAIGEKSTEYFMLEMHYDNPNLIENMNITGGIRARYSMNLRANEAGMLMAGYDISPTLVVPPNDQKFFAYGHCAGECTSKTGQDITVFGLMPHSHLTGSGMTVGKKSPGEPFTPILQDNHYDFAFQQTRLLPSEIKVSPGDQLSIRCAYNTSHHNEVTLGGLSTRNEMCLGFLWYYPKTDLKSCGSAANGSKLFETFDIEKVSVTASLIGQPLITVNAPEKFQNMSMETVMNSFTTWTADKRQEVQNLYNGPQQGECLTLNNEGHHEATRELDVLNEIDDAKLQSSSN